MHKYIFIIFFFGSFLEIYAQSSKSDLEKNFQSTINQSRDINKEVDISQPNANKVDIKPYKPLGDLMNDLDKGIKHFCYDYFTKRDSLSFWENLPRPVSYMLGPGDELVISIWGETQFRKIYNISRDGNIFDEKVGLLDIAGKTIEEGEKYLIEKFGQIYSTLKGRAPSSFMDVSLGKLRSINVNFVGEVKYPGVYPVHPFSTVIFGLIQSGGVDTTGSLRHIHIKRDGKKYKTVDLYDYFLKGSLPNNIQLRDQDIVVVPVREYTVTIDSGVVRPAIYEAIENEMVGQLINYAGGLKPRSSSLIELKRVIPIEQRKNNQSSEKNYYIDYLESFDEPVFNGDRITIREIFANRSEVEIIGQVKRPGKYFFIEGMKINDLIEMAGGLSDPTYLKSIYKNQSELVRVSEDNRYSEVIQINLLDILSKDNKKNINLNNLDKLIIHENINFFERSDVKVTGEVNIPGSYSLLSNEETLESLLQRAGNLSSRALSDGISIYRDKKYFFNSEFDESYIEEIFNDNPEDELKPSKVIMSKKDKKDKIRLAWEDENVIIMPGDSIFVKEKTKTVNIVGAVYNPGLVGFENGKSVRYYLDSAGGLTQKANKKGIIIVYANGKVKPKKWYSFPKIKDGATIIVNRKEFVQPFNLTDFANNIVSLLTSLVTIIVLSQQISTGS